ncbi:MAG: hypothetical protein O2994_07160, partial [Proteobacteria bacterium]|nr:hypothetical protein [Pseudomonadota bacterium]
MTRKDPTTADVLFYSRKYPMTKFALTVTCDSARGIVAAIAGFLADHGCNITNSSQFDDTET